MFCRHCGEKIPDDSQFCLQCGGDVSADTQQPQPVVKVIPPAVAPSGAKPPKKGKKAGWIIGISGLLVIAAVVAVILLLGGKEERQQLTEFSADEPYLVSGQETEVTFTVKASLEVDSISLYRGSKEVGQMKDNGRKGDAEAGDGIYTCVLDIEKDVDELDSWQYHCATEDAESEELSVYFFPVLEEEEAWEAYEDYQELAEDIYDSVDRYMDDAGNIPAEDRANALKKVTQVLDEAVEDEIVLHYYVTDYTVFVKMTSGLSMIWAPQDDNYDESGEEVTMTVLTLQPCYTDMGAENFGTGFTGYELPEDVNYILEMLDVSGQNLRDTLPNYRFPNSQNYDDSAVTLDVIRSFGANQIILWHGHGGYSNETKSYLVTGEDFDLYAYQSGGTYYADYVQGRILLSSGGKAMVTSKYITKYCGDMDNTLVYLAACLSGKTPELANAFTNKGAVVVANTESIMRTYNVVMLYATVNQMLKVNPETGEFYTLSEALANAKTVYGESDADSRYGGSGATPILFGEGAGSYRLMEEVPTGVISGKVAMASDRSTPISGATIDIYLGDTLFDSITADSDGQYELELPFGGCTVQISANGYIGFVAYTEVRAGQTSYMETFLMVKGSENVLGIAGGRVINSLSGSGESDVTLTITKNWNNTDPGAEVLLTTTTDYDGYYEVELPCGNYTVIAEKEGYAKSSFNIVVQDTDTWNQDGTITPEINGHDYLITLTWGANPSDVDSHMVGYLENGSYFHVYYGDKSAYMDGMMICNLDYDDTTSYGPEHITLTADDSGTYYYYLYHYYGSGSLASSEAKVTIEQGNRVIAEFYVPTNQGNGRYWNIFAIKDGEIIVSNTITSSADTSYAD